jgi:hypothetical protein
MNPADAAGVVFIHTTDGADTFTVSMTPAAPFNITGSFSDGSALTFSGSSVKVAAYGGADHITLDGVSGSQLYGGYGADEITAVGCSNTSIDGGPTAAEYIPGSFDASNTFNLQDSVGVSCLGKESNDHFYSAGDCSYSSMNGAEGVDDMHVSGTFLYGRIDCGTANDTVFLTGNCTGAVV